MIGRLIPETNDLEGATTKVSARRAKSLMRPTFPMGQFLACPLQIKCRDIADIRAFLSTCRYVSDWEQFGQDDYWLPPDRFEKTRAGDCEDYALWTWRQLMDLGYRTRFVCGFSSRYGIGHAWVTMVIDGEDYLVEPQRHWLKATMPRLSTIRYKPEVSVEWDGKRLKYFKHEEVDYEPPVRDLPKLVLEWLIVWLPLFPRITWGWVKFFCRLPLRAFKRKKVVPPRRIKRRKGRIRGWPRY
jgi:hypothetical protein